MTRLPLWALVSILMALVACSDQVSIPAATQTPQAAAADPSSITPTPANIVPTPRPQSTPNATTAPARPTPASSTEAATSIPTQEPTTDVLPSTETSGAVLAITVAPIPTDIAGYSRSHWKHWTDEDGDCQDARQEALISESLVEVTFESERECRVESGRWYGAFTGNYVEKPGDLDIDHLVPLKNAHDSGGWAWNSDRKQEYANYLGDPDHLIAVTKGANRQAAAADPSSITPTPANIVPTPRPQSTPNATTATARPTPASSTEAATSIPTQEPTTDVLPSTENIGSRSGDYRCPNPNGHRGV